MKEIMGVRTHTKTKIASLAVLAMLASTSVLHANDAEHAFLKENDVAMRLMHKSMHVVPSGDVDRDFVAMMVPHHQGAIDMAKAVLRYGRNEKIRRLAQEIIIEQQQEITAMKMAVAATSDEEAAP